MDLCRLISVRDRDFVVSLLLANLLVMTPYLGHSPKASLILVLMLFLIGVVSRVAYLSATILLVLISAVTLHLRTHWGTSFLESRIEVALIAPGFEVAEYLRSYIVPADINLLVYSVLALFFCFRAVKLFKYRSAFLHAVSVVALVPLLTVLLISKHHLIERFFPVRFVTITYETIERLSALNGRHLARQTHPIGSNCPTQPYDTVVVVIGESALRDRMSIYGHARKTTPFLESIEPFVFDAISPTNQTRFSVPIMLTSATVSDFSRFYRSPSIVTHLKNCGFDTHWISNQGRAGRWDTNVTTIAMEADHTVFVNSLPYQFGYDEEIIAQLGETEKSRPRKRAFFVHLTGSHAKYQSRYPEDFGLMPGFDVVSHYDNSIFYTDYVLSKIFDRFKDDELLFVYVSDHGEIVSNEKFGHGGDETYRDEYRIPLIVWSKHRKRLSTLMESSAGQVINTESFDNILRYLLGMDRTARLSYSDTVIAVDPANTTNYSELKRFGEREVLQAAVQP